LYNFILVFLRAFFCGLNTLFKSFTKICSLKVFPSKCCFCNACSHARYVHCRRKNTGSNMLCFFLGYKFIKLINVFQMHLSLSKISCDLFMLCYL
jgi:hypothetical protein